MEKVADRPQLLREVMRVLLDFSSCVVTFGLLYSIWLLPESLVRWPATIEFLILLSILYLPLLFLLIYFPVRLILFALRKGPVHVGRVLHGQGRVGVLVGVILTVAYVCTPIFSMMNQVLGR